MRRLRRFTSLSRNDQKLLARTAILLWLVRLGLWLLPYEKLHRLLFRNSGTAAPEVVDNVSIEQVVRGVRAMSRYVPAVTCLTKALVTMVLLRRAGKDGSTQTARRSRVR